MVHTEAKTVVAAVLSKTKELPETLFCWDGSYEQDDVLFLLKDYLHRFGGWKLLSVVIQDGVLEIKTPASATGNGLLLIYDIKSHREIHGRLAHVGITQNMCDELKQVFC